MKNLKKPSWIKIKLPSEFGIINRIKTKLRKYNLNTVCEEASCPNITECFNKGTATFMILGSICTRRCSFCNVSYGRPKKIDLLEPIKLAKLVSYMKLKYVVITSVDRDDLRDGGADHFCQCIKHIRRKNRDIKIEILVPDFRGCIDTAIHKINQELPDVFNHNIENVPRLYKKIRPGSSYSNSLLLLKKFKKINPDIPTKSGIMLGLGEKDEEIIEVMHDLRKIKVNMLTIGQYLRPSIYHHPVMRYLTKKDFSKIEKKAINMGFDSVKCGTFVRSSYHADIQLKKISK